MRVGTKVGLNLLHWPRSILEMCVMKFVVIEELLKLLYFILFYTDCCTVPVFVSFNEFIHPIMNYTATHKAMLQSSVLV